MLRRGALLAAALALGAQSARSAEPLRVVATIEPLCMLAREIGGERVACTTLVPAGASPHAYEPRPSALRAVADAQLLLRAGNGIDDWAVPLGNAGSREWLVLGPSCDREDAGCAHFWLDAHRALKAAFRLFHELRTHDIGVDAALGLIKLTAEAIDANNENRALLARSRGAGLVAFHPAWGDFAHQYGLIDLGAIQSHGAEEPTPRRLAELISSARAASVRLVLVEPQLDQHTARIVAEELGARLVTVDPLGDPRDPERASYTALLRWNARQLATALAEEQP